MLPQVDLITAVPTPSTRLRQRGLNLAWQLARSLAQSQRLPLRPLLQAPVQRAEQLGLSRRARQRNGGFQALQSISGASVLLVDDVLTTGSTLRAATQCLLQAGAQRVQVAALCRTPRPQASPDSRAWSKASPQKMAAPKWWLSLKA